MPRGELRILGRSGDTKIMWDSENTDEVANAKRTFDELKKKGFSFFSVKKDGEKGKRIEEFDASLEALIAVPRMVGG